MYGITQASTMTKHKETRPAETNQTERAAQPQARQVTDLQIENRLRQLRGLEPLSTHAEYTDSQLAAHLQTLPDVPKNLPPLNELQRMSLIGPSHQDIERLSAEGKLKDTQVRLQKEIFAQTQQPNIAGSKSKVLDRLIESSPKRQGMTAMLVSKDFYLNAADFVKQASHRTDYFLNGDKEYASAFIEKHNQHLKDLRMLAANSKDCLESRVPLTQFARTYLKGLNFECAPQTTEEDYRRLMYKTHDVIQGHIFKEHHKIAQGLAAAAECVGSYKDLTEEVLSLLGKETALSAEKQFISKQDKKIDSMSDEDLVNSFLNHYEKNVINFDDDIAIKSKKHGRKMNSPFVFLSPKKTEKHREQNTQYHNLREKCLDLQQQIHAVRSLAKQHNYQLQLSIDPDPQAVDKILQRQEKTNPYLVRHQQLEAQQSPHIHRIQQTHISLASVSQAFASGEKINSDIDEEIRILMQKIAEQDQKIAEKREYIAQQELQLKQQE